MSGGAYQVEEIRDLVGKYPHHNHYVGMLAPPRAGVLLFITLLEYQHYPPGTPANDDFIMTVMKWCDIFWSITSIPSADHRLAEEVAGQTGLKLVHDSRIMLIGSGQREEFPLFGKNVFISENLPGSKVYDPKERALISQIERKYVGIIHAGQNPDITPFTDLVRPKQP